MPPQDLRPVWNAARNVYRSQVTGQYMSAVQAAPYLRVWQPPNIPGGGALRDAAGQYVPHAHLGGQVKTQWPTGKADYAAVTRKVVPDVRDMPVRGQDVLSGTVSFNVKGKSYDPIYVTMPKGFTYSTPVWDERLAKSVVGQVRYNTGDEIDHEDVNVERVDWNVTTFYSPGEFLGADFSYFEGL